MATNADLGSMKVGIQFDTSQLESGLKTINKQMAVVDSSIRTGTSGFDALGKSSDSLKTKIDGLNQKIELQKQKIDLLKTAHAESVSSKGEDAVATQNLEIKLNNATTALNKMQTELNNANKELKETPNSFDKVSTKLTSFGDKISSLGTKLTIGLTAPLVAFAAQAVKTASNLQEVQNVVDTTFGKDAGQINEWAKNAMKAFGLTELQAKQMNGTMGAMLKSMGLTNNEVLNMSESMTGLAADFASFYNLNSQDAFDKIRSGISGETEPLKQLGINMSVANLEAYALSQGINKSYNEMSQSEQTILRYNYLLSVSKDAQGDFTRTSDSMANQLRLAQGRFTELSSEVGEKLLPYVNDALGKISELSDKFNNLTNSQKGTIAGMAIFLAAIGPIIKVIQVIIKIVAVLTKALGEKGALTIAFKAISGAVSAFAAALGISVGWAVLIIAGIVALAVVIVKFHKQIGEFFVNVWNSLTTWISNVWNAIPQFFSNIGKAIVDFISSIPETLAYWFGFIIGRIARFFIDAIDGVSNFIKKIPDYIEAYINFWKELPGKLWNELLKVLDKLGEFFTNMFNNITTEVPKLIEKFLNFWKELPGKLKDIGKNIVEGLFNGIKNSWNWLKDKVGGMIDSFVQGIKDGLGIHSPSKLLADEVGQWIPKGIAVGIDANTKSVSDSLNKVKNMATSMNLQYEYGLGAVDASKKTVNTTYNSPINLTIEHFENNSNQDIKGLMNTLEFQRKQLAMAKGGNK